MGAVGVVFKIGDLRGTQSFMHPTGCIDIDSERTSVQVGHKRVEQIAQAWLDVACSVDTLSQGRYPFKDGWAIPQEFGWVEYEAKSGLLSRHCLLGGGRSRLKGQFG
jgi:hypothetical protein